MLKMMDTKLFTILRSRFLLIQTYILCIIQLLQAGMALLSVDGRNVAGCTVDEAKKVINTSYLNKQHVSMKLEVLPMERSTTM